CDLASALYEQGRRAEAREVYRRATRLNPAWGQAAGLQAWILATHPNATFRNGREAERLAKQVVQASEEELPDELDLLAAAYAEEGRFEDALATQRKALEKASHLDPNVVKGMEERLRLYQQHQPFRGGAGGGTA